MEEKQGAATKLAYQIFVIFNKKSPVPNVTSLPEAKVRMEMSDGNFPYISSFILTNLPPHIFLFNLIAQSPSRALDKKTYDHTLKTTTKRQFDADYAELEDQFKQKFAEKVQSPRFLRSSPLKHRFRFRSNKFFERNRQRRSELSKRAKSRTNRSLSVSGRPARNSRRFI